MGPVKRVLITGASGFIGRATVAEALSRGLEVIAVVRNGSTSLPVQELRCDLASSDATQALAEVLPVDAVIHAAAHLGSTTAHHKRDSIAATETLLAAMAQSGTRKLVLVSSLAVYDTASHAPGDMVSEATPLDSLDHPRDAYVAGKLHQEAACRTAGLELSLLRPGAVYGPDRLWNAHIGPAFGPVVMRMAKGGQLPIVSVTRVAKALVSACFMGPVTANILDDDLPDRMRFLRAMKATGWPKLVLPLPWPTMMFAANALSSLGDKRPGLLRPDALRARVMPLRYGTDGMAPLGLAPSADFETSFAAALGKATP